MSQEPTIIPEQERPRVERIESPDEGQGGKGAPIHALSAAALLAIDNLWNIPEFTGIAWIVTVPLSFITVGLTTFLVQKNLKGDGTIRAMMFALLLGIVAAVPTSITGTPIGLGLLAWSGIGKWFGKGK